MSTGSGRTAVVTGAAGFIGSHLCRKLVNDGWTVRALDSGRSGDWSRVDVDVQRSDDDLAAMTIDDLRTLCEGADALFHLAAEKYNSSRTTPARVIEVNIAATSRLFEAAALERVGRVVFTSSLYAYGGIGPATMQEDDVLQPTTVYGMSKAAGEHLLRVAERDHGLSWNVARLFFIYGPKQFAEGGYKSVILTNFERMRRGEPPVILGDGMQELDYVYIDDCVEALMTMARTTRSSMTFNVASGVGRSINGLTASMCNIAGFGGDTVTGPPDWTAGTRRVGSPDFTARHLDWTASTSIESGLQSVWSWMVGE